MLIPLDAMDAEPLHIARCHNLSDLSYNTCMLFMVSPSVVNSVQFLDGSLPSRHLCKVALPQHTLKVLQLFLFKSLRSQLVRIVVWLGMKTYLDINVPSILAGLLEVCENSLDTLANHAWVGCSLPSQGSQYIRQPSWRRALIWEGLNKRTETQHSCVARQDKLALLCCWRSWIALLWQWILVELLSELLLERGDLAVAECYGRATNHAR